jgi:hypothetical protein
MHEGASIAEQSAPPPERPKRSNAAAEIPASGRRRATRATEQPAQGADESEPADTPEASVGEETPPAPASPRDEQPDPAYEGEVADSEASSRDELGDAITRMVDLIKAAGKDPEKIRSQLKLNSWEMAPPETIAKLTAKAQEALMDQAEAVATAPTEAPAEPEPEPTKKKPARRSRAKKEA